MWNSWKDNLDNNIIKQYSKTHSSKYVFQHAYRKM